MAWRLWQALALGMATAARIWLALLSTNGAMTLYLFLGIRYSEPIDGIILKGWRDETHNLKTAAHYFALVVVYSSL